jgi:uncharacterized membrane protein
MRRLTRYHATRALLMGVAALPCLPWLLDRVPGLSPIADALQSWFAFQCERDPHRTLHWFGQALPVCARCLGIYWGLGLGAGIMRPALGASGLRLWIVLAALLMALDVATEALGLRSPWAPLRVLTGMCLAYPVGVALVSASRARSLARG